MAIEQGVRQDETWIAVDPIVGCAKNCQYCFLQLYGATPKRGEVVLMPDESIDNLLSFHTYNPALPIMLGSETDVFMNLPNIEYFTNFLRRYHERGIPNPVALVTKCHIPDSFIEFTNTIPETRIIYYLSYSGLGRPIEPTTNIERVRENFIRLHSVGKDIVHYWRPFMPQNSSPASMMHVIDHVSRYARCTVAAGLKVNPGILAKVQDFWPELAAADIQFDQVAAVWPEGVRDFLRDYMSQVHPDYPFYWVNSCALAYVLDIPEFNGIYKGDMCSEAHCLSGQRGICSHHHDNVHPDNALIQDALDKMNITSDTRLDTANRRLIVDGDIDHGQLIYLRQRLSYPVVTSASVNTENEWGGPVIGRQDLHVPYTPVD